MFFLLHSLLCVLSFLVRRKKKKKEEEKKIHLQAETIQQRQKERTKKEKNEKRFWSSGKKSKFHNFCDHKFQNSNFFSSTHIWRKQLTCFGVSSAWSFSCIHRAQTQCVQSEYSVEGITKKLWSRQNVFNLTTHYIKSACMQCRFLNNQGV